MNVLIIHPRFITPELRRRLDADYPKPEWFHKLTAFNCLKEDSESFGEQEISGQPEVYDAIVLVGLLNYQQQILEEQGILNHLAEEGTQVVVYKPLVTYERSSYILPSHKVAA